MLVASHFLKQRTAKRGMTSAKIVDFLTLFAPCPHWATDLYYNLPYFLCFLVNPLSSCGRHSWKPPKTNISPNAVGESSLLKRPMEAVISSSKSVCVCHSTIIITINPCRAAPPPPKNKRKLSVCLVHFIAVLTPRQKDRQ